ncbi:SHOCT domain-containing protein [Succinatimonas hippei]|uniref:SHOCT domain-containing protein n=1 Tax=Succinatimonas hippei TaxID=626938 RepID=UPI0020125749|nr:SHOCT domain-containing protein [Succinatimonas hippei]MCL1602460.1 SHOCT domain-containing protein [Succinatimonas hippei]
MKTVDSGKIFTFVLLLIFLNVIYLISFIPCLFLLWTYWMYRTSGQAKYFLLMRNVCKYYGIVMLLFVTGMYILKEQENSISELTHWSDSYGVYFAIIGALIIYYSCKYLFVIPISKNLEYLTNKWNIKMNKAKIKQSSNIPHVNENFTEELQHLSDLVSKGVITSEEYDRLKKKLIDERLSS